jgi:two-component system cell cycle sensor histidine kinase/response regulator CckA
MAEVLRVLIVEDNPYDADLLLGVLEGSGFEPVWRRVETERAFLEELDGNYDIILSDYNMPQFSGPRAIELLKAKKLDIPLIIVSGSVSKNAAVTAIKLGTSDYLLKDRLARLGSAVTHAIAEGLRHREKLRNDLELAAERGRAEVALRESEERFRQVVENIHEVFWMFDPKTLEMLYVSPVYERIWGRTCESLYARPQAWLEAIRPGDRERVRLSKQAEGIYDEEYRIVRPDGTERWIRDRAFPVKGPDGAVQRIVGVAEDITDRMNMREQFLRTQRMEAIGTLASGVAHDLNNVLAPILMAPGLLRNSVKGERELRLLDLIEQGAFRGAQIVRQLLTFSRGSGGERISVQLRHLLKEMTEIMHATFPREIAVSCDIGRDLRTVTGDATQLHQVLMNLCVNARDAMPGGGKLTLSARNIDLTEADVQPYAPAKAGPYVSVSVVDTGSGIAPEIAMRIFEPFFTTKEPDKGTGLGLSTAMGIIRSHNGFISVGSAPGKGSTFTAYLPAASDSHLVAAPSSSDSQPQGDGELILVVDDEASVRTATSLVLEQHGYRVMTAGDGAEALMSFAQNRDKVRVVLTDVSMPVMGGIILIRALRAIDPKIKVIATSGREDKADHAELDTLGIGKILVKPCDSRELLGAVRKLVTEPS